MKGAHVRGTLPLSDNARVVFDGEVASGWYIGVGSWFVEVRDGVLIVRSIRGDVTVLQVPADDAA